MSAYLVLMQEIHDQDRYRNEYLPGVRPFLQKYGAELLVAGSDAEPAEGEPPNSTVVIRFADASAGPASATTPPLEDLTTSRVDQHTRVQDAIRIDGALGGAQGAGEQFGALMVIPGPVQAADGVVMGDRPACFHDRL